MNQDPPYRQIFKFLQIPCLLLRVDGGKFTIEEGNDSFLDSFKTTSKQLIGKENDEFKLRITSGGVNIPTSDLLDVLSTGRKLMQEVQLPPAFHENPEHIPIEYWTVEHTPLLSENNRITHILSTFSKKSGTMSTTTLAEEAIKKSERRYRVLVREGTDLLAILDSDGSFKFLSEATKTVLGLDPGVQIIKTAFQFIHSDDLSMVLQQFEYVKNNGQEKIGPFRIRRADNSWAWFETIATNKLDDPAIEGIITSSRDITTTVTQAREIQSLNERYQLAATATKDLMYDWDIARNEVIRFHRNNSDLLGIKEIESEHFWNKQIHPEDYPAELRKRNRVLADPTQTFMSSEYRFQREDGNYAMVLDRGFILRNENGKPVRLVGALRDISDITAKEEALKTANKRFTMALEATNEMVWDWDIATDHVIRSKTFHKIFGYNVEEHTSMENFWLTKILRGDKERVHQSLSRILMDPAQSQWKEEYRFLKADGEVTYIVDRGYIIRDKQGKAHRMVGAVLDVSDSRRLIKKIKKQNKILRQIAWEQSHIVRAPIARMKSLLEFMELGVFDEMSQEEIWAQILASTDELDNIVKKIVMKTEEMDSEPGIHHQESLLNY